MPATVTHRFGSPSEAEAPTTLARAWGEPVLLVGALSWAAAAMHGMAAGEHSGHWPAAVAFFAVVAAAQLGWGALVAGRPSATVLRAGIWASLALVALWLVSRTVGVPFGPDAGGREAVGLLDVLCVTDELLLAACAGLLLQPDGEERFPRGLIQVVLVLTLTGAMLSGGHTHPH